MDDGAEKATDDKYNDTHCSKQLPSSFPLVVNGLMDGNWTGLEGGGLLHHKSCVANGQSLHGFGCTPGTRLRQ